MKRLLQGVALLIVAPAALLSGLGAFEPCTRFSPIATPLLRAWPVIMCAARFIN